MAGFPATTASSGTSLVTTLPAPTKEFAPIIIPGSSVEFAPIFAFFFIVGPYIFSLTSGNLGYKALVITTLGPIQQSSSSIVYSGINA